LKCVKRSANAVNLEATSDQVGNGNAEEEKNATVTIHLGYGSYAPACASLSHLFTKCGHEKEICDNSR
jgi:hypothetical protein